MSATGLPTMSSILRASPPPHEASMTAPHPECILFNARLVLAERVIERGWLAICDGVIAEVGEGAAPERGEGFRGDLLVPGLVELHTDHLEAHYSPRPKVDWDPVAAGGGVSGPTAPPALTPGGVLRCSRA